VKVRCEVCGEEILNERQVVHEGTTLCRACAGQAYYQRVPPAMPAAVRLSIPMEAV
jgi:ribosome-binding protein aMBF1 (putative translation factor)